MNIDIVERAPARVAYLRYTGPFGEPLARFWRYTVTPWLAELGLVDCPRYGVALDDPSTTPPGECRYHACVELSAGLTLPDASLAAIPGGRYAITFFKGTGAQIGAAWGAFVAEFAARELHPDPGRMPFEHYPRGASYDQRTGAFACELCIPVGS